MDTHLKNIGDLYFSLIVVLEESGLWQLVSNLRTETNDWKREKKRRSYLGGTQTVHIIIGFR